MKKSKKQMVREWLVWLSHNEYDWEKFDVIINGHRVTDSGSLNHIVIDNRAVCISPVGVVNWTDQENRQHTGFNIDYALYRLGF